MIDGAWMAARLTRLGVTPGVALVGVSGGPDSLALLHLLREAAPGCGLSLIVAHADHGIHPDSGRVADDVAGITREAGLPFERGELRLGTAASESVARRARFGWFRGVLQRTGARYVFLAHHREDQAETILMRVLAGSGPAGLAGMVPIRGRIVRPLLEVGRDELREALAHTGWEPWDDPANCDSRQTRSWLRHQILPLLQAKDPDVVARLLRVGAHAAADRRAWDAVLGHLPGLALTMEHGAVSVAATPLMGYDSELAQGVLRALLRRAGAVASPGALQRLVRLVREGASGSWVPVGGRWRGELAFGRLRIAPERAPWEPLALPLGDPPEGIVRVGSWTVRWQHGPGPEPLRRDGWTTRVIPGVYALRPWQPGDRLRPLGGSGSRLVVRCMQDRKLPRSERSGWPVFLGEAGEVVWVPGVCRADGRVPSNGEEGVRVDVEQS
jgi:tRNA(Ile)-lysidine synthase